MPTAILTPRVNNNDDFVRFICAYREPGSPVHAGDVVADIETDKATVAVEAETDGFLLGFVPAVGDMIRVGSTLAWLGSTPGEPMPEPSAGVDAGVTAPTNGSEPTLKATLLLARHGLTASQVPAAGGRLTAQDVLTYVERHDHARPVGARRPRTDEPEPELPAGRRTQLTASERGMLKTVSWHRDAAVAGYVEIELDAAPWEAFATAFQQRHQLLMSPLLPLMAYRLVELARDHPKINSTIVADARHEYETINLGFTLQTGAKLSLLSVRDAGGMTTEGFVDALGLLMRQGMKGKLTAAETSDVTIAFSSMARWEVIRHVPVLPPYTAFILAHTHAKNGTAALGASYDHRVLTGGEVAAVLRELATPGGSPSA